ncbi:MAG: xylulokinase [Verrucomicrobiae bacterium]|nr:xylulokinase [Verrucomicrobiae bacterium]
MKIDHLKGMPSYFIGIDSGTQSAKAILVKAGSGQVAAAASQSYDLIRGLPPGHMEQHPQVWINAVRATIRAILKQSRANPSQVLGIGVSGQQHGFVPLDRAGKVIRPAKLWCDTSTAPQCETLLKKIGGLKQSLKLTGNGIPSGFTASKILWLKQKEPKNYARLTTVLLPHDYINFWLTGNKTMEYGDASGTALFDVRKRVWSRELLRAIGPELAGKLPTPQPSHLPAGHLCAAAAKELGLTTRTIVSSGGGDNMMGAIGTGNTKPGVVTASFGTSGAIYACSNRPVVDPQGEIAAFCDSAGAWLPLLCTMNVTVATEMIRQAYGWTHEEFTRRAGKIPAGSCGLLLVPYLNGERTPNVPNGTGVFVGVNGQTFNPSTFARAAMEGVTMGMNYGLNRLRQLGIAPRQIRVIGGGAKNPVWRQIMADVFNCEVIGMRTAEGAAYGAALQAWWCCENQNNRRVNIDDIASQCVKTDPKTAAHPRTEKARLYRQLQQLQDRAAHDMSEIFDLHRATLSGLAR